MKNYTKLDRAYPSCFSQKDTSTVVVEGFRGAFGNGGGALRGNYGGVYPGHYEGNYRGGATGYGRIRGGWNYNYASTDTCFCRDPEVVSATPTTQQKCLTADGTCGVCIDRNVTACRNCDDSYTSLCQ